MVLPESLELSDCGLARGGAAAAAVGAVEAAALEHDADGVEQLAQLAGALAAHGQASSVKDCTMSKRLLHSVQAYE